jgi:hypothetical protein
MITAMQASALVPIGETHSRRGRAWQLRATSPELDSPLQEEGGWVFGELLYTNQELDRLAAIHDPVIV